MKKKIICDTNVFYNVGWGNIGREDIAGPNEEIYYSPVSVIEIAGGMTKKSHADRKGAAQAILDLRAKELDDPETFLTKVFGYPLAEEPFDFAQVVKAIAQSTNMKQLVANVPDYVDLVQRRVSVKAAAGWRQTTEGQWMKDMIKLMCSEIPKFAAWYDPDPKKRKGRVPTLSPTERKGFLGKTTTFDWCTSLILACQQRSFAKAKIGRLFQPTKEDVETLVAAIDKVLCYGCMYTQYLIRLLTQRALPDPNDSGDLELFVYCIDDDHVVATCEKLWPRLAKQAGYDQRVRKVM